jgi:fatty acid desaturase
MNKAITLLILFVSGIWTVEAKLVIGVGVLSAHTQESLFIYPLIVFVATLVWFVFSEVMFKVIDKNYAARNTDVKKAVQATATSVDYKGKLATR